MLAYNKLIVAVVSVLLTRALLRWTGIDIASLGVETEFHAVVTALVDVAVAGVTGFMVWWVPNVQKRLRDTFR